MSATDEALKELKAMGVVAQPYFKPRYDLNAEFDAMKEEVGKPIPSSYEAKRNAWWDGMMKFIINMQLSAGASIPRVREAEDIVKKVYEDMVNQGRVDFHLANPGETLKRYI